MSNVKTNHREMLIGKKIYTFSLDVDTNKIVHSGSFFIKGRLPASMTDKEIKDGNRVMQEFFDGKDKDLLEGP